jgi:protein involved in polysaccharide export with SLBB domain
MRLLRATQIYCRCGLGVLALAGFLAGCGTKPPPTNPSDPQDPQAARGVTGILRVNDRLKIDITGTPKTIEPIETVIADDGTIPIPLLGPVKAAGETPGELGRNIQTGFVPRFYTHCNIAVTPTSQYFYVSGEMGQNSQGGRIPLSGPMTVSRAIATAGGFSPFANRKKVVLIRVNGTKITVNCRRAATHPEDDPPVYPGDSIYIPRRF